MKHETEPVLIYIIICVFIFFNIMLFIYTYRFMQPHFSKGEKNHLYLIRFINIIAVIFSIIFIVFISSIPTKQ